MSALLSVSPGSSGTKCLIHSSCGLCSHGAVDALLWMLNTAPHSCLLLGGRSRFLREHFSFSNLNARVQRIERLEHIIRKILMGIKSKKQQSELSRCCYKPNTLGFTEKHLPLFLSIQTLVCLNEMQICFPVTSQNCWPCWVSAFRFCSEGNTHLAIAAQFQGSPGAEAEPNHFCASPDVRDDCTGFRDNKDMNLLPID